MTWKRTLVPVFLLTTTNAHATDKPPTPPPDFEVAPELLELRATMADEGKEGALANVSYFRPLCDAEGYPLVGNILPKNPEDMPLGVAPVEAPYAVSEFCGELRKTEKKA